MRYLFLIVPILFFINCQKLYPQQTLEIDGIEYALHTEVEGPLTLLWNVIDEEYRFFAKKDNEIVELKNTRQNGKYLEEYKETLSALTTDQAISPAKTSLTIQGLRSFFNSYNKLADPGYQEATIGVSLETRLGVFGGVSNNPSTTNPQNVFAPLAGIELEITDTQMLKRHGVVLQFRHSFKAPDYDLTFSQFSLNYRYKFIHNECISVFLQSKFIALTFYELAEDNEEGLLDTSGSSLQTPIGLGVGLDYRLKNGFITFAINDIVAPGMDNNGEFPVDITLGYKIIL